MSNQPTEDLDMITFTPELRDSLRKAYVDAVQKKLDEFTWDGHQFVTSYAGYLLEHLGNQFG